MNAAEQTHINTRCTLNAFINHKSDSFNKHSAEPNANIDCAVTFHLRNFPHQTSEFWSKFVAVNNVEQQQSRCQ